MDIHWLWLKIRDVFKQVSIGKLVLLLGIFVFLIVLTLVLALPRREDPMKAQAVLSVQDRGALRVAVRDRIPRFSEYDEQTGAFSGLEVDLAKKIAERIFGREDALELVPTTVRTRTAKLESGEADIAIAMFNGSLNTSYLVSKPYYIDAHAIMVRRDTFTSFEDLDGRTIGVLQGLQSGVAYGSQSHSALIKLCQQRKLTYEYKEYASYDELKEALSMEKVDAIALEAGLIQSIFDSGKTLLNEAVSQVPYCVAARKGNEALIQIASEVIDSMQKSGELRALIAKWGLPDFMS